MNRTKSLATACSLALSIGAWCSQSFAQQTSTSEWQRNKQQTRQQSDQQKREPHTSSPHNQVAQQAGEQTNTLLVGQIIDARDVTLAASAGDRHRLLKVRPADTNREVVVDIGVPRGEIAQADFSKGDRIIAMGKPARINGRPVLFAANVAELHSVGRVHEADEPPNRSGKTGTNKTTSQSTSKEPSSKAASSPQRSAATVSTATSELDPTIIVLFESENLGSDEYGAYDEDFAWETNEPWYESWNDPDASFWNSPEEAHYDMYGYDDSGEAGLWDW